MTETPTPFTWAPSRKKLPALAGKRLIVHVVVNLEHWPFDQPMPRPILPGPHSNHIVPDVPNYSWVEYGMRCGLPRILRVLQERNVRASAACNAGVVDAHPDAATAVRDAGWEFLGHGLVQRSLQTEPDEQTVIAAALDQLAAFTGIRPRGWLGPALAETLRTPTILVELGVDYVLDWPLDDLPVWITTDAGPLIGMPYALELNDSILHAVEHNSSSALADRVRQTLHTFEPELELQPRILTIGLHPHLIGVPHRVGFLAGILDLLMERDDVIFATGAEIADWYAEVEPFVVKSSHS